MMQNIFVWGFNFKTAPVSIRELLACNKDEIKNLLPAIQSYSGVKELVILNTCNRIEVYTVCEDYAEVYSIVESFLDIKGVSRAYRKHSFFLEGKEALAHIFRVASSLDSMVVGESQIVAQFKDAFQIAKEAGTLKKILNRVFEKALRTAKRVRTETGIGKNAVSVSYVAVELAKQIFGNLSKAQVLLVGAGKMAELASKYFKKLKANIFIANRTYERALELAKELGGNVIIYEELEDHLHKFDIVLLSTGAKSYVLTKNMVEKAMRKRDYRPMFIIDISVPRNAEPDINEIDQAFLYNIDDLRGISQENLKGRLKEKEKGEIIVWDEVEKFFRWLELLEVEDKIVRIKTLWEDVEKREPKFRKFLYHALKEIKKDPRGSEKLIKILLQEDEDGNKVRKLPYVYNRADGAGI
ncbi:glutamyl-tRNA reductase [Thermocrinis sp.]